MQIEIKLTGDEVTMALSAWAMKEFGVDVEEWDLWDTPNGMGISVQLKEKQKVHP